MSKLLSALLVLALPIAAHTAVVFDQPEDSPDGYLSDAWDHRFFYSGQVVFDDFTLGAQTDIQQIIFYGSSDGFNALDNSDFSSLSIHIVRDAPFSGPTVLDATDAVANFAPVATGEVNQFGGIEYQYSYNAGFTLSAGHYFLSVGANVTNAMTGSYWEWSLSSNRGANWLMVNPDQFFELHRTDLAFTITSGPPVPEPVSLAGVALGLISLRRRRRSS